MKSIWRKKFGTVVSIILSAWAIGRNAHAQASALPDKCTLMAMSPAERTLHLRRLEMLRRAATTVTRTVDGFTFQVNLAVMPAADLEGWATNEQKCCSYLKIFSRMETVAKRGTVRIVCPADLVNETAQAFGLNFRTLSR